MPVADPTELALILAQIRDAMCVCLADPAVINAGGLGRPKDCFISHGDPADDCCFAAETEIVTANGTARIGDLVGQIVELMTTDGAWVKAPIRSFGQQPLWDITLTRDGHHKTIRATGNHRWLLDPRTSRREQRRLAEATTDELKVGDLLATEHGDPYLGPLDPDGIRAGIVYGDGSRDGNRSRVQLYGPKRALASHFDGPIEHDDLTYCGRMPAEFKDLPDPGRDLPWLAGWLAGYLATDGSVAGGTVRLASASEPAIAVVRDICYRLGIRTSMPTVTHRTGYGDHPTPLWYVSLHPHPWLERLLIREDQRDSFRPSDRMPSRWRVLEVSPAGVTEEVFCATVPDTRAFLLADHILTGNCDFLAVWLRRIYPTRNFPEMWEGDARCNDTGAVLEFGVRLMRPCFPTLVDNAFNPFPDGETSIEPAAIELLIDAWVLECCLMDVGNTIGTPCRSFKMGELTPAGPRGGCAGWTLWGAIEIRCCGPALGPGGGGGG